MIDLLKTRAQRVVETAGGRYRGTMEAGHMRLILFDSPQTGSTLALDVRTILGEQGREIVMAHIAESDRKFGVM